MKTQKERMLAGELYLINEHAPELKADLKRSRQYMRLYNQMTEDQLEERTHLLKKWLKKTGKHLYIEPSFKCDYGSNISVGEQFYANFDCIILDVCPVTIGDHVMFGPRVSIFTAGHPIDAEVRISGLEFGEPVSIGNNVWVGGGTIINPGVHIGDNCVIGSGSVVTKDIPDNVIAVGNPCRILRPITDKDRAYWTQKAEIFWESIKNS